MVRVAFCDDDVSALRELQGFLERYRRERGREMSGAAFCSPLELLAEVERGKRFDILFLDILMPGQNGIETAEELRRYDGDTKIIFLTSSKEFAVQSYGVEACFYQLKPMGWQDFCRVMDHALERCRQEGESSLLLRCSGAITRLELGRLEFCEVIHRTLLFHLSTGRVLEATGSLDELERQLASDGRFFRVHRSYIVNLDYVQSISHRAVTMTCLTEIPIPRGKYGGIRDAFMDRAFRNWQVNV